VGGGDASAQATFALDLVEASVAALGGTLSDVVRTRIYVRHIDDWEVVVVSSLQNSQTCEA
jgi:enamine deaminase RidA (YjgF/YER057c/UK114 family)